MVAPRAGVVARRGVGMDRDEQVGVEPAGDLVAVLEHADSGRPRGSARPAPGRRRRARRGSRGASARVMSFSRPVAERRGGAGIAAAMAGDRSRPAADWRRAPRVTGGSGPRSSASQRVERDGDAAAARAGRAGAERAGREQREQQRAAAIPSRALCRPPRGRGPAKMRRAQAAAVAARPRRMLAAGSAEIAAQSPSRRARLNCAGFACRPSRLTLHEAFLPPG